MNKMLPLLAALLLPILCLAGCGNRAAGGGEQAFDATILEIQDGRAVVEAAEGAAIRNSADQISFSTEGLDEIGAEVGDIVTVVYTGPVMESYPAQITAVSWSLVEKGVAAEQDGGSRLAAYSFETVSMSLELPAGWEYEIKAYTEGGSLYGLVFWPKEEPSLSLYLAYHANGIGICGTCVTCSDIQFPQGLTATACVEQSSGSYWFFLIFNQGDNKYAVECATTPALWAEYEDQIMSILDTAALGGDVQPE